MFRKIILSGSVLGLFAALPTFAQTTNIVRESIPSQGQVVVANSPEDIALQEEIRKIRAYNAYVDSQIGVSGVVEVFEPAPQARPAKVELFEQTPAKDRLLITYHNKSEDVTAAATIIEREAASTEAAIHTVAEGDTLYRFARNRCVEVTDIQNINDLSDANIRLGQKISLPASKCDIIAASSVSTQKDYVRVVMPVPTSAKITRNYAVLPNDSLYSIGRQYCVSAEEMAAHNGIALTKAIQPGQILDLPSSACVK